MQVFLRISMWFIMVFLGTTAAFAQPENDDCASAFNIVFADNEESVIKVDGDTRGASASTLPAIGSCSGSFFSDDIWFTFTTPATLGEGEIVIRAYFGDLPSTDVPAIGMALYAGCGDGELPITCFSSTIPEDDRIELPTYCMLANNTYAVRVWSTGNDATTEGTLRMGVYFNAYPADNELWVETFDTDPFTRGWTTSGVCAIAPDSSVNAVWEYLPTATIPGGAFTPVTTIPSRTFCDGAIGVNSDFNDSNGNPNTVGMGSVPTALNAAGNQSNPATYEVMTPSIFIGDWGVPGISVTFDQALRDLNSTFTVAYRNRNEGDADWGAWNNITINDDVVPNAADTYNSIRLFLPNAHASDSLQLKLVYLAHYYFWMVDDFRLVETECNNTRVQENFYAIAPWAVVPPDHVYPFAALADIYNAGSCPQTNTVLNYKVVNQDGDELYNQNNTYGTINADSLAENKVFGQMVTLPAAEDTYIGTYTLTTDAVDFDPSDNTITHTFRVNDGGLLDTFALEEGFTRSIAVNNAIYDPGAPLSYAFGNIFYPQKDEVVDNIVWGVNNPGDMQGKTVSLYLLEWNDNNGDRIAESNERRFVGFREYTFTGTEGDNAILSTVLENFDNPGDPVEVKAGKTYMVVVEYVATVANDPQFFLLADDTHNYNAQTLAIDSAIAHGLTTQHRYVTVLGFSPDGNIANIDYEVRELNVNDTRIHFGDDLIPLIRMVVGESNNTKDPLAEDHTVTAFPNPVSNELNVKLEFGETLSDVSLRLLNPLGQTVISKRIGFNVTNHIEKIDVSDLSAGNYLLQVETVKGQRTLPVVIIR